MTGVSQSTSTHNCPDPTDTVCGMKDPTHIVSSLTFAGVMSRGCTGYTLELRGYRALVREDNGMSYIEDVPELKSNVDLSIARDDPHTEVIVILSALDCPVDRVAHGLRGIPMRVSVPCTDIEQGHSTDVYEVPLSSMTTALSEGAPCTVVESGIELSPMRRASKRTVQRIGSATGKVGIFGLFTTSPYSSSYSPGTRG